MRHGRKITNEGKRSNRGYAQRGLIRSNISGTATISKGGTLYIRWTDGDGVSPDEGEVVMQA